jgi:two-component system cell cycle response regulator
VSPTDMLVASTGVTAAVLVAVLIAAWRCRRRRLELEQLSVTDALTGLWNYRFLQSALHLEIERATRFERPLSVLMLDLDWFHEINERYGHQKGSQVLKEFGERVGQQIRQVDLLVRYGGEEFVAILPETAAEGAAQVAERICRAVREQPFGRSSEPRVVVTVSVGAAVLPLDARSVTSLLRAADEALYEAKAAGRDTWRLAGS